MNNVPSLINVRTLNKGRPRPSYTTVYLSVGAPLFTTIHWNRRIVILAKLSSLAVMEAVMRTFCEVSDEDFVKMIYLRFGFLKHHPPITVTVVKRTRVPAGYLVKMATDADVDSGRKRTLIRSVEAYTWNGLFGKIRGGIRNIQCKSRLRGTFYRCTRVPRKNIFWRGCFVFMFCRCGGYLYFFTRVPGVFTRVPALYKGAWFVSHFHYRVFHRTLVAQTRQQTCGREFCYEK